MAQAFGKAAVAAAVAYRDEQEDENTYTTTTAATSMTMTKNSWQRLVEAIANEDAHSCQEIGRHGYEQLL
ncbi:hypothetical protein ACA910_009818 [Epithemia clementina (nom. ined.)]